MTVFVCQKLSSLHLVAWGTVDGSLSVGTPPLWSLPVGSLSPKKAYKGWTGPGRVGTPMPSDQLPPDSSISRVLQVHFFCSIPSFLPLVSLSFPLGRLGFRRSDSFFNNRNDTPSHFCLLSNIYCLSRNLSCVIN